MSWGVVLAVVVLAGCGRTEEELQERESEGCLAGEEDGSAAGESDGAACLEAAPEGYGADYAYEAQDACQGGSSDASAKDDMPDPCIERWMDGYRSCYESAYTDAYDAAAEAASCP